MNEYPLLFTWREIVEGSGFVSGVICNGRALMEKVGEDEWHVSGVEPGGLSELGATPHEAYFYFRRAFTDALRVFAQDSGSYEDFSSRVKAFFGHRDATEDARWSAARDVLRSGAAEPEAPFKELPREKAEEPRQLSTVRLDFQKKTEHPAATLAVHQLARGADDVGIARVA